MLRYILALLLFTSVSYGFNKAKSFQMMLAIINIERVKEGASPLTFSPELSEAAQYHDDEMAKYGYYNHQSQVNDDRVYDRVLGLCNTLFVYVSGENMDLIQSADASYKEKEYAKITMDSLIGSPDHLENMVNPLWNYVGMGYAKGKPPNYVKGLPYGYYTTHVFACVTGKIIEVQKKKIQGVIYVFVVVEEIDGYIPNSYVSILDPYYQNSTADVDRYPQYGTWGFYFPYVGTGIYTVRCADSYVMINVK